MLSTSVLRSGPLSNHAKDRKKEMVDPVLYQAAMQKKERKERTCPVQQGLVSVRKINKHVHHPIGVWTADCCLSTTDWPICLSAKFTSTRTGHRTYGSTSRQLNCRLEPVGHSVADRCHVGRWMANRIIVLQFFKSNI
jgi:hypothetical protein